MTATQRGVSQVVESAQGEDFARSDHADDGTANHLAEDQIDDHPAETAASCTVAEPTTTPGGLAGLPELAALSTAVADLARQLEEHHVRAAARERVIEHLHAEVERLRVDESTRLLRPLIIDMQRLHSDLLRQARTLPAQMSVGQVADLLGSFALSVELTLERCGRKPILPSPGEAFSTREHRAVRITATANPQQDGTIAEVVASGYRDVDTDRVTAPAAVHVLRWTPPPDPPTPDDEPSAPADEMPRETPADDTAHTTADTTTVRPPTSDKGERPDA